MNGKQRPGTQQLRRLLLAGTVVVPLALPVAGWGQDYTPPREMRLQEPSFEMPDTAQFMVPLNNGMMAFVVGDSRQPLITFTALVRGGKGEDEEQGAAEALTYLMRSRGPCWMAPGRFAEALEDMAASFYVGLSDEMIEVTLNVPLEDAMQGLRIFSGIVREPCIDPDGLEAFAQQGVGAALPLAEAGGESGPVLYEGSLQAAFGLFHARLFENHPYGEPVTREDAEALSVEDVERFHRRYFVPVNVILAISGAFEPQQIVNSVDQRFGDWEARRLPRFSEAPNVRTREPREVYAYRADKLQTWIVVGHELPQINPQDWPALEVMNYILGGGHFDTRLFRETRDKRGLTNDASGFLDARLRGPGSYTFRTYGRPEVAQQLVDIVFAEVNRIRNEPVTEEELFVAKGALADGVFAMKFAAGDAAARALAEAYAHYGTLIHLAQYVQRIRRVSARDVQRAAERYLHPERMKVVMLGPAAPGS
jgi:predicted Zn-dependent peptidase